MPQESSAHASLENILADVGEKIEPLEKGDNLLVETENQLSLIKYEGADVGSFDPSTRRVNRADCVIGLHPCFFQQREPKPYDIQKKAAADLFGTCRIDFTYDLEFGIYLPAPASDNDRFVTLANERRDGSIERFGLTITTDQTAISERLLQVTRPRYFARTVLPFLQDPDIAMPQRATYAEWDDLDQEGYDPPGLAALSDAAQSLEHGDFVYVGSQDEVYLLGVLKDDNGFLYRPGRCAESTQPAFRFANDEVGHMRFSTIWRPALVRPAEPEIVTPNLSEAIEHFSTTDFAEFEDVLAAYHDYVRGS